MGSLFQLVRQNFRLGLTPLLLGLVNLPLHAQNARKPVPLSIVVTDRSNAVVSEVQIKICSHGGRLPKVPQRTNEYGKLRSNLEPGIYDLFVTGPPFKPWSEQIQLNEESAETVTVVLEGAGRTLARTGHGWDAAPPATEWLQIDVTDEAGVAVAFAQLLGLDDLGERHNFSTMEVNDNGELRVKVVPTKYLIAVTSPGYERWEELVEVGGTEPSLKIALKRMLIPQIAP